MFTEENAGNKEKLNKDKKIELLAPAGNREALHAAVENGADAVYLGGKLFSARQQADNFGTDVLKEELQYAHARGVNIYLTMNTLVSDVEMEQALMFAAEARRAGIDGIIVQDLGLAAALRKVIPDVSLHGSTQMTIYDKNGVRALEKLGFQRVVLARELSLTEASDIARDTFLDAEVFVHGALCICYSGQCLMSSMLGGRSGNRGKCAQPCRLPYRLSGSQPQYLLSPKDMWSLENIVEIADSGIHSLKIEGRMKSPEYVATVVRIYRKYLDMAVKQLEHGDKTPLEIDAGDRHDLLQIFNRGGFSFGYMKGKSGADMMSYDKPNNSGIFLGNVISYDSYMQTIQVRLEDKLNIGDGIQIWTGGSDSPGGIVSSIRSGKQSLKSADKGEMVEVGDFKGKIAAGKGIYKTTDIELNKSARDSFSGRNNKQVDIAGVVSLKAGNPLLLQVDDGAGHVAAFNGTVLPEKAINKPLTEERLREQLSKTGSTPFRFSSLKIELENDLTLPVSEINEVRRTVLDGLLQKRADRYAGLRIDDNISVRIKEVLHRSYSFVDEIKPEVIALYFYRWDENTDYECLGADRIYLPLNAFLRPGFQDRIRGIKAAGTEVFGWLPAITRGNTESMIERFIERIGVQPKNCNSGDQPERMNIDGILVGNISALQKLKSLALKKPDSEETSDENHIPNEASVKKNLRLAGDMSLNIFNALSVYEAAILGLESATLSGELTLQQMIGIAKEIKADGRPVLEAVVYGRLPLMVSEYCVPGSTEGGMKSSSKCSGCCTKGDYSLQDRMGIHFPVLCDKMDCRNTILNSNVLFVPDVVNTLKKAGIDIFRLYIWEEKPEQIKELVQLYRASAAGDTGKLKGFGSLSQQIKEAGHTKGHYFRGV